MRQYLQEVYELDHSVLRSSRAQNAAASHWNPIKFLPLGTKNIPKPVGSLELPDWETYTISADLIKDASSWSSGTRQN